MTVIHCGDLLHATRKVATTKYQGILVDYSDELIASALINGVRGSTSNAADVVFAFIKNADQAAGARRMGANFVVPQPFTADSVAPYIRAGYGLMVHELQRYFRAPVVFTVHLTGTDRRRLSARSIDLSSGGLAIVATENLIVGKRFDAVFQIPGSGEAAEVGVTVCWTDGNGRAGLRFLSPSELVQATIQRWLRARIDKDLCADLNRFGFGGAREILA